MRGNLTPKVPDESKKSELISIRDSEHKRPFISRTRERHAWLPRLTVRRRTHLYQPSSEDFHLQIIKFISSRHCINQISKRPQYGRVRDPVPTLSLLNLWQNHSLEKLAATLNATGPVKVEPTPRRVRALFNGTYLFDTTSALHVWEHKYFPQFWVPRSALSTSVLKVLEPYDPDGVAFRASITVKDKTSDRVLVSENGPLKGYVRVEFKAAGIYISLFRGWRKEHSYIEGW